MEDAGVSTIEHGDMTLTSVGVDSDTIKESLASTAEGKAKAEPKEAADKPAKLSPSDHARELGKRGGKAAAEKREAAEKEPEKAPEARQEAKPKPDESTDEELADEKLTERQRKRVEQATRRQAEIRRELDAEKRERQVERQRYEAELAAHRVNGSQRGQDKPNGHAEPERASRPSEGKPSPADFESYEEYLDARDSYNRQSWEREHSSHQYADEQVKKVREHVGTFLQHVKPEVVDDWDPDLRAAEPYYMASDPNSLSADSFIVGEAIYAGPAGPAILTHLSNHPEELRRVRSMKSAVDIRVEIMVLARTLGSRTDATAGDPPASGERAPKPSLSKANPPVRPVTGAPSIAEGESGPKEGESFDSWMSRTQKRSTAQR